MAGRRRTSTRGGEGVSAACQVDAQDRRQQLRAQADRQRDREQQRLDQRALEQQVDHQHADRQHRHGGEQQVAELADAAIELGFRRSQFEPVRDGAELRSRSGGGDQQPGTAAAHVGAEEDTVAAPCEQHMHRHRARLLARRSRRSARPGRTEEDRWLRAAGRRRERCCRPTSSTTSPGTTSCTGTGCRAPSRSTAAWICTRARRRAAAVFTRSSRLVADPGAGQHDREDDGCVDPFAIVATETARPPTAATAAMGSSTGRTACLAG